MTASTGSASCLWSLQGHTYRSASHAATRSTLAIASCQLQSLIPARATVWVESSGVYMFR